MNPLRRWWERYKARKLVPWKDCVYSPQKAAEKQFTQMLVDHHMVMFRMQAEANLARWTDEFNAQADRFEERRKYARRELQRQTEIAKRRQP